MVSATDNPKILRIEVQQPGVSDTSQIVIVCFMHARLDGVQIYYSHHLLYSRALPKGNWDDPPKVVRMELTPNMRSQISYLIWSELWNTICGHTTVQVAPFEPDAHLAGLES